MLNSEKIGGGNRILLELFEGMDRSRYQPIVMVPAHGPVEDELVERDVPFTVLDTIAFATHAGRLTQLRLLHRFTKWARRNPCGIYHSNGPDSYRLASIVAKKHRVSRVCHIQSPATEERLRHPFRIAPDIIVPCSRSIGHQIRGMSADVCGGALVKPVVNCADLERFTPGDPPQSLREELALSNDEKVVTIVGQVCKRKGHPEFLRMAAKLVRCVPDTRFLILGEDLETGGAFADTMRKLTSDLGISDHVTFLGFRPDVPDVIRASDIVVLPSHGEGLPLSLIEASACARPVVAYDIPGVDEAVIHETNGLLVPENDIDALTDATARLLANPDESRSMGGAGRVLAEKSHSKRVFVENIQHVYDIVLHGTAKRTASQRPKTPKRTASQPPKTAKRTARQPLKPVFRLRETP